MDEDGSDDLYAFTYCEFPVNYLKGLFIKALRFSSSLVMTGTTNLTPAKLFSVAGHPPEAMRAPSAEYPAHLVYGVLSLIAASLLVPKPAFPS